MFAPSIFTVGGARLTGFITVDGLVSGGGAAPAFGDVTGRAYSSMQAENESANISLPTQSVFVLYDQFEAVGAEQNATGSVASQRITVDETGDYYIAFAGDCQLGEAGETYQWELSKNGGRTLIGCRIEMDTETNETVAGGGTINLGAGNWVDLRVRCTTKANTTIRGRDMTMTVVRVG